jgi:flagellar biosynthetic protein FliP
VTLPATLGILAALAFVLSLMALAVWALKRFGAGKITGKSQLPVEIVQRLSLGPKAGLAIVRVGEKVLAISVGEGGVHTLFEVDEADRQRIVTESTVPVPLESSALAGAHFPRSFASTLDGLVKRGTAAVAERPARQSASAPEAMAAPASMDDSAAADAPPIAPAPFQPAVQRVASAPTAVRHRDLQQVLSMTLAPSTRLLSALLVAGLALGSVSAQAQGGPPPGGTSPDSTPPAQPATPAPVIPVEPVISPTAPALPTMPLVTRLDSPTMPPSPQPAGTAERANAVASQPEPASAAPASTTPSEMAGLSTADAVAGMVPQLDLRVGNGPEDGLRLNGTVGVVVMMGLLSLVPTLVLMMTGFTRILIVLHFLKQAMGTQSAPPAHLVGGLALLLTGFVMAPTLTEANRTAVTPWLEGRIEQTEMLKTGAVPFREFMLRQTNEGDLRTFVELSQIAAPATPDDVPLHVLMSAFVASELRTAFQIGFAIYLPFIVIDAVVASVLMAMGMFMLPPAMISLPFKLLLFVLVDGWSLTIQSLIQSFR